MDSRFDSIQIPGLKERLERWDSSLLVSKNTRASYTTGLLTLIRYTEDNGISFDAMEKEDILNFRNWLEGKDYKPSTVSLYLAGVRSFYRFLAEEGEQEDIAMKVKGPKLAKDFQKEALTRNQALELLASIDQTTLVGLRDYALINLMIRTGLRDIEVSRALSGDIEFDQDANKAVLYIQGKGRNEKDAFVVLEEAAHSPIRQYLLERRKAGADGRKPGREGGFLEEDDPLFSSLSNNSFGAPLSTRSISRIVKNRLCAIGLTGAKYTAHSLRHSAVTFSLLGGASVQEAQVMARHANINTTLIYAHNINRMKNAAETKAGVYLDGSNEK